MRVLVPLSNQRKIQLLDKIYGDLQVALRKNDMQRIKTLMQNIVSQSQRGKYAFVPVSYTQLTLPTKP